MSDLQVVGVVAITTLTNRQYCVILDPVGADGKPQLGQKKLVKVLLIIILVFYIKAFYHTLRGVSNYSVLFPAKRTVPL